MVSSKKKFSGSYADNSSAIAICATMGDNVVPGTYTPLKHVMVLADDASYYKVKRRFMGFLCLTLVNEL